MMSVDEMLAEWHKRPRRTGCVAAAQFVCDRVEGFRPMRVDRWTEHGHYFSHVVAYNGSIVIDLVPHKDAPSNGF